MNDGRSTTAYAALDSAAWYDKHIDDYVDRTESVDLTDMYDRFLAHIPAGGAILDAGCGSGRDSRAFLARGYRATPMDASLAMVRMASKQTGIEAIHLRHQDVAFENAFDGVWSNASLLHVPHAELPTVLHNYRRALKPEGVLFASFKRGDGEEIRDDRLFAFQTGHSIRAHLSNVPLLELIETWTEPDRRPGRASDVWLQVLCRRCPA